jgi:hypothetical protein
VASSYCFFSFLSFSSIRSLAQIARSSGKITAETASQNDIELVLKVKSCSLSNFVCMSLVGRYFWGQFLLGGLVGALGRYLWQRIWSMIFKGLGSIGGDWAENILSPFLFLDVPKM